VSVQYKRSICRLQPPKREQFDFVQQMIHGTCCVSEQSMVSFIPQTQTQSSQMSCRKDRRARGPLAEKVNWTKWSGTVWASVAEKPIQERTITHREPKVLQERNKCWVDSMPPQPDTQNWTSGEMIPRATKFVFVGSRSRRRLYAKMETFRGTCLCHTRSSTSPNVSESWKVKSWCAPRTE
jgi:hypothetical protein